MDEIEIIETEETPAQKLPREATDEAEAEEKRLAPYGRNKDGSPRKQRGRPKGSKDSKIRGRLPDATVDLDQRDKRDAIYVQRRFINFVGAVAAIGEEAKGQPVPVLRKKFWEYVTLCSKAGMKLSNQCAYAAIGISAVTASAWRKGQQGKEKRELIDEVNRICSMYRETLVENGQLNVVWAIWSSKNFDGMKDNPGDFDEKIDPMGEEETAEEIADKYKDLLD